MQESVFDAELITGGTLFAVNTALAVAPGLEGVRCVVERAGATGEPEPIRRDDR
jgi:hypothetical protein